MTWQETHGQNSILHICATIRKRNVNYTECSKQKQDQICSIFAPGMFVEGVIALTCMVCVNH